MPTLTERQQTRLDELHAEGRACAGAGPRVCATRATVRVGVTLTEGAPRSVLLPMCERDARDTATRPLGNGVVVDARFLDSIGA